MENFVRIVPCLDIKDGRVVKGIHFVNLRDAADPGEAAQAYAESGADEIAFLDITATVEKRRTRFDVVRKVAEKISIPLILGGGLASLQDIEQAFECGASCVSLSSAAFRQPELVEKAARKFGSRRIIVAIDVDVNENLPSKREVYIDGGRTATGKDAVEFAREMKDRGAGQVLPTSKTADGTKEGYDLILTRAIAETTRLPVIASGGAGCLDHFYQAVTEGKASAVLAASVFHFGIFTVRQVKEYLKAKGVAVNL
ncbi:MAG: imidazole glycerol phosphate synthase subunit HisF [Candidatus Omnitrophica bacterium]|nr:imidazole glycerol phosphate synthase subunit HisF [Candidatus Omnitrophota bacterium]